MTKPIESKNYERERDAIAQEYFDKRDRMFNVGDFSREVVCVESFKSGADWGREWQRRKANCANDRILEKGFDHPCRQTCSGWKQGFERGQFDERRRAEKLVEALREISKLETDEDHTLHMSVTATEALAAYEEGE